MAEGQTNLATAIARHKEEADISAAEIALRATVAGVPYAGGPILEIWGGLAQRRAQRRLNTIFEEMKKALEEADSKKVDQAFFESEEFQTLLFLMIEKLHTTHDQEKLKMFGSALANSANSEFQTDDKEEFIRILRDLSKGDLHNLDDKRLKGWLPFHNQIEYGPEILSSLSRLVGLGLVLEKLKPSADLNRNTGSARLDSKQAFSDLLTKPPKRFFVLSPLGSRFLNFVSSQSLGPAAG